MAKDTKERILDSALEIFARDGYTGTNIKDIAEAVGIVKSALYRHFENKEAIWQAVKNKMEARYEENMGAVDGTPAIPKNTDELCKMTMGMVNFTVHDEKIRLTRKFLMMEQFRTEEMRELANEHFLYGMEARFTRIFDEMMKAGTLKQCDPGMLAFSYTTPITALIHFCDRNPEKVDEAMAKMQGFVKQFIAEYGC